MAKKRDTSRDGFKNKLETLLLNNFKPIWQFLQSNESLAKKVNKKLINSAIYKIPNRIAGILEQKYPEWDDERLFQTTRNILIVLIMKVVIDEYINHITPYHLAVERT